MAKEVVMPALEMAQDQGTLIRWLKQEGDFVEKGEPLMDIETDKADIEVEAPASGTLCDVSAQPGDEVPVGQVIARIVPLSESQRSQTADIAKSGREQQNPQSPAASDGNRASPPVAKASGSPASSGAVLASPKARRLAAEAQVDLSRVAGSGPQGSIVASDLLAKSGPADDQNEVKARQEYTVVRVEGMRRAIAERLQLSHQNAPHISLTLSVDMGPAQSFLRELKLKTSSPGTKPPGMTTLICKAAGAALLRYPRLNSHFLNDEIHEFRAVHLGVAVALDDGLVVPVVRNLHEKNLLELQSELDDLAGRARGGRLRANEFTGGTFTVTNLGMYGIEQFSAILNPPEVGILSIGTIRETPAAVNGSVCLTPSMQVTVNADHRAVDGAVGAQFLSAFKALMQDPGSFLR